MIAPPHYEVQLNIFRKVNLLINDNFTLKVSSRNSNIHMMLTASTTDTVLGDIILTHDFKDILHSDLK